MRNANVAIFVPHAGCPQQCSFCDQRFISGKRNPPTPDEARKIAAGALKTLPEEAKPAQIAFFGGSFTAMDKEYMVSLLESVQEYLDGINYSGIRISTRPDAIDFHTLKTLEKYRVTDIELGAQSMSDTVLQANLRGHRANDTSIAASHIKEMGFKLGLQLMTGLYQDTTDTTVQSAHTMAKLSPDYVRVYPTVVLRGTKLAELAESGRYTPQTLEEAVRQCSALLEFFTGEGIPVIRMGLHDSPDLAGSVIAGPYHPAFRELCESRALFNGVLQEIEDKAIPKGNIRLFVSPGSVSKMTGQRRENMNKLLELGFSAKIIPDERMPYLKVKVTD